MTRRPGLVARLLRQTLAPGARTGPRTVRRLALLTLFVPVFLLLQLGHWIGFALDELFFRGYRRVEVKEPLFVVGLPRSGTTFLHRVLARDDKRFTTLRLWELLLAPSVTERRLWMALGRLDRMVGRPLGRLVGAAESIVFRFMDDVHPVSLDAPEEDYFLLLPAFACLLLVVPFPTHPEVWRLSRFDELPPELRRPVVEYYRDCIRRHLYVVGSERRLLSKNPSFTPFVASLREAFPDARFVACVRDPLVVVPSMLSSLRRGGELFDWDIEAAPMRDRFVGLLEFYAHHLLDAPAGWPDDRWTYLRLPDLKEDVAGCIGDIYERFGWTPSDDFAEVLALEAERSRAYRSGHRYSLREFGLTPEGVKSRFSRFSDRFGFHETEDAPA